MTTMRKTAMSALACAIVAGMLAGCTADPETAGQYPQGRRPGEKPQDSIFGEGGLFFGGKSDKKTAPDDSAGGGIGVNSFLWRATLDTVSFMPVSSADPFGGVVITDWYSPPEAPRERFKMNVYILGRSLRADGVRVSVFRQVADGRGAWRDAPLPEDANSRIEDAILAKARQLRFSVVQ